MKISRLLMFIVCLSSLFPLVYATDHVVISELGVNPYYGIDFTNDGKEFIELYNPTNSAVDISNWYITFKGMASTSDVIIPSGTSIRSHGYYLIGDTGGNGWPSTWSKPDLFDNFQLTNTNFGIKLLNRLNNVIDAVGWGSLIGYPDYYETQSLDNPIKGYFERKPGYISPNCGNWQDTNNNSNDFLDNSNPSPQNSSFTEQPCNITVGCITNDDCNNLDTECADGVCNLQTSQCQQQFKPSTTLCRASAGVCDLEEKCTGTNATCPADIVRPNTYECRATAGECDVAEKCDGTNKACPSDTKKSAGASCGQARDCSADKCNGYFAEFYPIDGHDTCDGQGNCLVYSCVIKNLYCSDNDETDGVDTLECNAQCDQDEDCGEGNECNLANCNCVLSGEPYCGDGIKNGYEECDGQDFGSLSCDSFDYDSGLLVCNECLISTDGCFNRDTDDDGIIDAIDNCPNIANAQQQDSDNDGIGDVCDVCPYDAQDGLVDSDNDGIGDVCDFCPYDAQNDIVDGDEYCANVDNCPAIYNVNQTDTDNDGIGDVCDYNPPSSNNGEGGGGGGGGGGGSVIRKNTSMATSSTVTVKPVPKKPSETKKEIPAETTSQEIQTTATEEISPEPEENVQETIENKGNIITGALVAATSTIANMFKDNMILKNVVIPFVIIVIVFVVVYFNVRNRKKSKKNRKRKR